MGNEGFISRSERAFSAASLERANQQRSGFTAGESEVCCTPPSATIMIKKDETGMPSGNWKWLRFYGKICIQMWRKSLEEQKALDSCSCAADLSPLSCRTVA